MCVMKMFKGHIEMVQEICKINVMREKKLPQAVIISDGILAIASNKQIELKSANKSRRSL